MARTACARRAVPVRSLRRRRAVGSTDPRQSTFLAGPWRRIGAVAAAVAAAASITKRPPVGRRCGGLRPRAGRGAPPPPTSSPIHDGRRGRPTNLSAGGCPVEREPPSFAGYCATGRAGRLNAGPRRTHSGPPRCIRCGDAPAAHLALRRKGSRTYLQRSRATPAQPRSLAGEPFFLPKHDAQKPSYPIPLSRATESA